MESYFMKENTVQWIMYYYLLKEAERQSQNYAITTDDDTVGGHPMYISNWGQKIKKLIEVQRIYEYERDSGEFVRYFATDTDIMIIDNAALTLQDFTKQ